MSDLTQRLLKLISEEKTINEISEILNLSHKRIYNILSLIRNKGFDFEKKYYYNGDMIYIPKKILKFEKMGVDIITREQDNKFTTLVISDIHLGSGFERLDLLDKIYDYCVKNGIHIIINCGDLIDGTFGFNEKKISSSWEQVEYLLKNYPFDKSILNFAVLGDHDYSILSETGRDLMIALSSYRQDIVPLGYAFGVLNIKNDRLVVQHKMRNYSVPDIESNLILKGHSHLAKVVSFNGCCFIKVPSLSDLNFGLNAERTLPGAFVMEIIFSNNVFQSINLTQLVISDKIYVVNEMSLPLYSRKKGDFSNNQISEDSYEIMDSSSVNGDKTHTLKLSPHPELQPPVYVPPILKNPASLSNIRKRRYKWE